MTSLRRKWLWIAALCATLSGCAQTTSQADQAAKRSDEKVLVQEQDGAVFKATVVKREGDLVTLRRIAAAVRVGEPPPAFHVTDLAGKAHELSAYRGQVLVLHFWASWCPFCRRSIPSLVELYQQRAAQGMQLLAISTDQQEDTLRQFVEGQKLPYPIIASRDMAEDYEVEGIPVTVVVDRDGIVRLQQEGYGDEFISVVERLLGS